MTTVKEAGLATIDMKLEVIVIPVSDVDARSSSTASWDGGRTLHRPGSGVFQFTPHGSACSVNSARASLRRLPVQSRERT